MKLVENWHEEKNSHFLYRIIAAHEQNANRQKLFLELADLANKQAQLWQKEIEKRGQNIPNFSPDLRTRIVAKLIHYFGAKKVRFILSAMKVRGMSVYTQGDPNYPYSTTLAHHEHRHKGLTIAGNLRAAIFGINDGLVSNMSLILGIAGATSNPHIIILSGVAGLLAGASSMAAGEYISVRSQREFYEYQIELEREELRQYPEEETMELAAIYHARGLPKTEAVKLSKIIISNPEKALETLAREELGLDPNELGSPYGAAISSFISFGIGALLPLFPFLINISHWNILISIVITGFSLFSVGALLSLYTNRSAFLSGLRMLLIGASAGCLTYLIGYWIGVKV